MHFSVLAALLPVCAQDPVRPPACPFDRVVSVEIVAGDPILEGHGPSKPVDCTIEFSGTLHAWTKVDGEFDTFLRIEGSDGKLLGEDDDSGGKPTPYVKLEARAGTRMTVTLAGAKPGSVGKAELHLIAAPETEATRSAAERARSEVAEIQKLREAHDVAGARDRAGKALEDLLGVAGSDTSELVAAGAWDFGYELHALSILGPAARAWGQAWSHRSRTLPDAHADLQTARYNLAGVIQGLGELQRARELLEKALEVYLRTLPDDHPTVQSVREHLAGAIYALGDIPGARTLMKQVLDVDERTLPEDSIDLQAARMSLSITDYASGNLENARTLQKKVLEVYLRTLPDEDPRVQVARTNLALTIYALGDLDGARTLQRKVLDIFTRTLPNDHPNCQVARLNLALTLHALGDLAGARALDETVLEIDARTLPDDHPSLQTARLNFALTLQVLGQLEEARTLLQKVLEIDERTLSDDHPNLQTARLSLAETIKSLGDLAGARVLEEKVLEVRSRLLPDDHADLQRARGNLADTMQALGDLEGARALEEEVLEVFSRVLPPDHADLQAARMNLALTIQLSGHPGEARALEEEVVEALGRTLPPDHPSLQTARLILAKTLQELGDLAGARALEEKVLEVNVRTLPGKHVDVQAARESLAVTIAIESESARRAPSREGAAARGTEEASRKCSDLICALCRSEVDAARDAIRESSGREAEERCSSLDKGVDVSLSFASGFGVFGRLRDLEAESFVLAETIRGAGLASAELTRRGAAAPRYAELRVALRAASDELAGLAQKGATSEAFDRARLKRESVERELVALASTLSAGMKNAIDLDVETLAARLEEREVAVGYRRFRRKRLQVEEGADAKGRAGAREVAADSLCAFVVRSGRPGAARDAPPALTLVDLGPIAPIEAAVRDWRGAVGVTAGRGVGVGASAGRSDLHARGATLRQLVFDPLLPTLEGSTRVVLALDDVLHLVPLDALPFDEARDERRDENRGEKVAELLGDRWRIETRSTLAELLEGRPKVESSGAWVGVGGVSYEGPGDSSQPGAPIVAMRAAQGENLLEGTPWEVKFGALPATREEVEGIASCAATPWGTSRERTLLEQGDATKEKLLELAPRARWLHIATHGWFAKESIRSWSDPEPLDKRSGMGLRRNGGEQVQGMSPMLLCGLALAGANLPVDAAGRVPGLVTAEELSALDLTNCELVVLSACDTNVGERRAGQGVASLQRALQMAGARSVITSLWKVPDEATKDLMIDFYRRLWVEKQPKGRALWEAKQKIRSAKDESGKLKYTTRDWAAWVLTGDPN